MRYDELSKILNDTNLETFIELNGNRYQLTIYQFSFDDGVIDIIYDLAYPNRILSFSETIELSKEIVKVIRNILDQIDNISYDIHIEFDKNPDIMRTSYQIIPTFVEQSDHNSTIPTRKQVEEMMYDDAPTTEGISIYVKDVLDFIYGEE